MTTHHEFATRKATNRRTAKSLARLFFLALCLIGFGAHWFHERNIERTLQDMEQSMEAQANGKAALLTVWFGPLLDQMRMFTEQDMLRLFAASVRDAHASTEVLLRLAQEPQSENSSAAPREDATAPALRELAPRLAAIHAQLKDFQTKNSFLRVALLNPDLHAYLAVGETTEMDTKTAARAATMLKNREPVFLPVRWQREYLVMDMLFPVLAPRYMDATGERVDAWLLVTCPIQSVVEATTRRTDRWGYSTALLEIVDGTVQRIDPKSPDGSVPLPDWRLHDHRLPAAMRKDPSLARGARRVFSLAQPVPLLPWLLEQYVSEAQLKTTFAGLRKNVLVVSGLLALLTGVILAAFWWVLRGRNERTVADQMRRLFLLADQQKQILDGVNAALTAGVVLNDLDGLIFYANPSFATMTGRDVEQLLGLRHTELPEELAHSLAIHTRAVYDTGQRAQYTEVLTLDGSQHCFMVSCSPFCDTKGRLTGVVSVYNDISEQALAQERAQRMVTQTVAALVHAIEAVDGYLCGQSAFTGRLAVMLAARLGKNDAATLDTLRTAASLSQVGMIHLPHSLLTKTDALTDAERQELRKHVDYAREVLSGIDFGLPVLEAITQMYERLDGSGYPAGLKGEAISFNARVLAVANTFCALMRPRSYRMAHDVEDSLAILETMPPQYDPHVVQALREFLKTDNGTTFLHELKQNTV